MTLYLLVMMQNIGYIVSVHACTCIILITSNDCILSHIMWFLGRLLPTLVGQYVPEDDKHWCN